MIQHKTYVLFLVNTLILLTFAGQTFAWQGIEQFQKPEPLSQRIANYSMDVKLDTENRIVKGKEILTWRNTTQFPTSELQFHLYYNAWRNDKSSYLNNSNRYLSRDLSDRTDRDWAYSDVKSVKVLAKHSFWENDVDAPMEYIQPDDDNENDKTVMRVSLPKPVGPGETVSVEIEWESKVPRTFSRTGVRGDYYFLAQWFPKVGVLEQDGEWNTHQFVSTEFYADFGNYDVRMTTPTGWVLGATGREVEQVDNGDGTTTHHYYQEDVHDFAWTAAPHFTVYTDRFEEPGLPPVEMRLLLMHDHSDKKERYITSTKAALKSYGTWFGPYPYDHVTIVDPGYRSGSGGMEYPTFFTGGTRWLSPEETRSPESVTIHEFGHGYWYGIVANNEFEDAWIDEGLNTYSHLRTLQTAYPPVVLTKRYFEGFIPIVFSSVHMADRLDGMDGYHGFYSDLKLDPISTLSNEYGPGSYGLNSYNRPAMTLRTLENYFGWDKFQKVMSAFYENYKFKHPKPRDFFNTVNDVSGENMDWFFNQAFNTANIFDYAVGLVRSKPVDEPMGYVGESGALVFQKDKEEDEGEETIYDSWAFVRRWGEAYFPVDIEITFSNGEVVTEKWDGKERWKKFTYRKAAEITKVEVDPDHVLVLDFNYSNNSWVKEPEAGIASRKWASKWMIWMQNLMEFFSFFS